MSYQCALGVAGVVLASLVLVPACAAPPGIYFEPFQHPRDGPQLETADSYGASVTAAHWDEGNKTYLIVGAPESPSVYIHDIMGANSSDTSSFCSLAGTDTAIEAD